MLADALRAEVWPLIASRDIRMPICATFPLEQMAAAHAVLDDNRQIGKVAISVGDGANDVPG